MCFRKFSWNCGLILNINFFYLFSRIIGRTCQNQQNKTHLYYYKSINPETNIQFIHNSSSSIDSFFRSLLQLLSITYYVLLLYFAWKGHYWDHSGNKSNCMITSGKWRTFGMGPDTIRRNSLCRTSLKSTGFKLIISSFDYLINGQRWKSFIKKYLDLY